MPEQQIAMPPQSPIINQQQQQHQQQAGFGQQPWQHSNQYQQFNQRAMPPNQTNSNPPTPHQQMPPPPSNLNQQQQQQPGQPQSPIVQQMNPQFNHQMGMVQRNSNFAHNQYIHSQFGSIANQIPAHHQYQTHGMPPQAPPPQPPPQAQAALVPPPPPPHLSLPIQLQPEFRVYEMNRRLASRSDNLLVSSRHSQHDPNYCYMWYDSFVHEFFDDNAKLNIRNVQEENVVKNYSLSRALIPRFFRSFSEDECTELNFQIHRGQIVNISNASAHQQLIQYESDMCTMNCKIGRPMFAKLCVEGTLILECVLESSMPQAPGSLLLDTIRIKNFTFVLKRHQELIPRSAFCALRDTQLDKLSANLTKTGLGANTMKYLKLCSVVDPMHELIIRHKLSNQSPRDCLKAWAVQRMNVGRQMSLSMASPNAMPAPNAMMFQRSSNVIQSEEMMTKNEKTMAPAPPVENAKSAAKRRKRKPSPNSCSPNEAIVKKEPNAKAKKTNSAAAMAAAAAVNQSSTSPVFNFNQGTGYATPSQQQQLGDVMVVGEPSLMGGDFGEEDERLITRLENNQFDSIQISKQACRPGSFGDQQTMMPPRPQSTSHFVNSNLSEQQARSLTPSPSTSNVGPKTPTGATMTPQNQMVDLNLNGNAAKSPSMSNGAVSQAPSTSTSTSAIASSSSSLSPNSLFSSASGANASGGANPAVLSPGPPAPNKQAQLNTAEQSQSQQTGQQQQQQQKSIFLSNY